MNETTEQLLHDGHNCFLQIVFFLLKKKKSFSSTKRQANARNPIPNQLQKQNWIFALFKKALDKKILSKTHHKLSDHQWKCVKQREKREKSGKKRYIYSQNLLMLQSQNCPFLCVLRASSKSKSKNQKTKIRKQRNWSVSDLYSTWTVSSDHSCCARDLIP